MAQERNQKKSHTGRNVGAAALLLALLLGGGHFGLGIGKGGGGDSLLPGDGNSVQTEAAPATSVQTPETQETQEPEETVEAPGEADDGVLSIVVREDKLFYEGEEIDLAALEQALLRDFVNGETRVTLTDDHAIKSAYDEATALLDRLGIRAE